MYYYDDEGRIVCLPLPRGIDWKEQHSTARGDLVLRLLLGLEGLAACARYGAESVVAGSDKGR